MGAPITNFDYVLLPPEIAANIKGGPRYRTLVAEGPSGAEYRRGMVEVGRLEWTVEGGAYDFARTDVLIAFFRTRKGRTRGFLYLDYTDRSQSIPINMEIIDTTHFQLLRSYSFAPAPSELRPIYKPISGSVQVYQPGAIPVSGWTVDLNTGIVTFGSPPAYLPAATFQFYVPVRFGVDHLDLESVDSTSFHWPSIPLVELMDDAPDS